MNLNLFAYPIEYIHKLVGEAEKNYEKTFILPYSDGKQVRKTSQLSCFYYHGYTCVNCKTQASHFTLDSEGYLKLHGKNKDGIWVTFNKDHIVPRKFNGEDNLRNLQTMCVPCNKEKDCKLIPGTYKVLKSNALQYFLNFHPVYKTNIKNYFSVVLKKKQELSEDDLSKFIQVMFKNTGRIIKTERVPKTSI